MGNFLRRSSAVHPASGEGGRGEYKAVAGEKKGPLRIKVRMRRDKLEELLYLAQSNGGGNKSIGFLILKECMEGHLQARVLDSGEDLWSQRCERYLVPRRLGSITEE